MRALIAALLLAGAAGAVTQDEIDAQRAVVAKQQAVLDSLLSLHRAEQVVLNPTLAAGKVRALVASAASKTGLRDPQYVNIEVPYVTWDESKKALWRAELIQSRLKVLATETAGLYRVRQDAIEAFLVLSERFIVRAEEALGALEKGRQ
jgi:hypothetical protein